VDTLLLALSPTAGKATAPRTTQERSGWFSDEREARGIDEEYVLSSFFSF
jgi:hypothetical protein